MQPDQIDVEESRTNTNLGHTEQTFRGGAEDTPDKGFIILKKESV